MSTPYRAPDDPSPPPAESERSELGDLRSTHTPARGVRLIFIVALAISVVCAVVTLQTRNVAPAVLGGSVLLFALVPLWLFSELIVGLGSTVEVWDEGLVVRRRWTEPVTLPFDEIDAVYVDYEVTSPMVGVRRVPTAKVTLTTHDDRRVVIPRGLARTDEILAAIDRKVERPLIAPARKALAAGEPLTFGPLVIDGDGLTTGGRTIPWSEIERIDAEPDCIHLHEKGSRWRATSLDVRDLPHPRVLVELLGSRVKIQAHALFSA